MVADNDWAVRDALQFALQMEGFRVRGYSNGAEVLNDPELACAGCLVIADQMRGMDGFQVLTTMRRRSIDLPTILIVNRLTPSLLDLARAIGICQVLEKPFLNKLLTADIQRILSV
jgi:FixJ family two-component response regulator